MNKSKFDSLPEKGKLLARDLIAEYGTITAAAEALSLRRATLYERMQAGRHSFDSKRGRLVEIKP